jgi:hypothetical protein
MAKLVILAGLVTAWPTNIVPSKFWQNIDVKQAHNDALLCRSIKRIMDMPEVTDEDTWDIPWLRSNCHFAGISAQESQR